MEKRFELLLENLRKNNMEAYFAKSKEEVPAIVESLLNEGETITCGGSVTLSECGVTELMKNGKYTFLDRSKPGLTREDVNEIYTKTFSADAYLTSANAVTLAGELINVDGNGNRVAAIVYGPQKVIVIVGANKIVDDVAAGFHRVKTVAAPKNAVRLSCDTPCRTLGHCIFPDGDIATGCSSEARICAHYQVAGRQRIKNRIKVILCEEQLGY